MEKMKNTSEESFGEKRAKLINGPITIKQLTSYANSASLKGKRNKIKGPMETISLVSPRVKQKLRLEIDEKQINGDLEIVMGDIEKRAAEASCQPH